MNSIICTIHAQPYVCTYIHSKQFTKFLALEVQKISPSRSPLLLCSGRASFFTPRKQKRFYPPIILYPLFESFPSKGLRILRWHSTKNRLTNGRLSGNTEKNFKHVLYLPGVQRATLRRGLPSKQAGLGIRLQNNYRCKENTFPLRKKLDDILQSSVNRVHCVLWKSSMFCAVSRLQLPAPAVLSEGVIPY